VRESTAPNQPVDREGTPFGKNFSKEGLSSEGGVGTAWTLPVCWLNKRKQKEKAAISHDRRTQQEAYSRCLQRKERSGDGEKGGEVIGPPRRGKTTEYGKGEGRTLSHTFSEIQSTFEQRKTHRLWWESKLAVETRRLTGERGSYRPTSSNISSRGGR